MKKSITVIGLSGCNVSFKVEHFARKGETIFGDDMIYSCGGKGFNQAIGCTRLSAPTTYISIIGKDENGKACRALLEKEKLSCIRLIEKGNAGTSFAAIHRDRNADNIVTVYSGVSDYFTVEDVRSFEKEIAESDFLMLQLELPICTVIEAINIAESHGIKVVLNPAPAKKIEEEAIKKCYLLTPNETEAVALLGLNPEKSYSYKELAVKWRDKGYGNCIITLGEKGVCVIEKNKVTYIHPIEVKAVDTTGAGDVFNAGLVAMLSKGMKLVEAAQRAVWLSGKSVETEGVIASIPFEADLREGYIAPELEILNL